MPLADRHVPDILAAFDLGSQGRLSDGPVASGRLGSIWRLDTDLGSWAVKQVEDATESELAEIREGAAFQEAAFAAGVSTPAVRRAWTGDVIATAGDVQVQLQGWVDLLPAGPGPRCRRLGPLGRRAPPGRVHGSGRNRPLVRGAGRRGSLARDHPRAARKPRAVHGRARGARPRARRPRGVPPRSAAHPADLPPGPVGGQPAPHVQRLAVRLRLRQRRPGRPGAGAGAGPRRVQRGRRVPAHGRSRPPTQRPAAPAASRVRGTSRCRSHS